MRDLFSVPSSEETSQFYNDLTAGKESRGVLGLDYRYNVRSLLEKESLETYFDRVVSGILEKNDRLLDYGCGPGTFSLRASRLCREVVGADISESFVESARRLSKEDNYSNVGFFHVDKLAVQFEPESFDAILFTDVIHHLEDIDEVLAQAFRFLKPRGKVLIYEPNKLNPMIAAMHVLDRNEWGLLKLGTPRIYRKLLRKYLTIERLAFNGIVIGPTSKAFDRIAGVLNHPWVYPALGWLNPKIFIYGRKC